MRWFLVLAFLLVAAPSIWASGTVTNASLAELLSAIRGGGTVRFLTNGSITITNTIAITNNTVFDATLQGVTLVGSSLLTNITMTTNIVTSTNGTTTTNITSMTNLVSSSGGRLFNVATNITFELLRVSVVNGSSSSNGGAILNQGILIATDCTFSNNVVRAPNGRDGADGDDHSDFGDDGGEASNGLAAQGGAVFNAGTMRATRTVFRFNNVTAGNGGLGGTGGGGRLGGGDGGDGGNGGAALGGAIYNLSSLTLTDCSFIDNSAAGGNGTLGGDVGEGGNGFLGDGGTGNQGSGAAIYNSGTTTVERCTFQINAAEGGSSAEGGTDPGSGTGEDGDAGGESRGGAIYNLGTLNVLNSTFADNQVAGGNGGNGGPDAFVGGDGGDGGSGRGAGIFSSGIAGVTNSTFSGGRALAGTNGIGGNAAFPGENGSAGSRVGGAIVRSAGTFRLLNSVLAGSVSAKNGNGAVVDLGGNLSSDNTPAFTLSNSRLNKDPRLGTLSSNGGFTLTFPLLAGSPAINGGTNFCPAIDQRFFTRPADGLCDIGSYEAFTNVTIVVGPASRTVTNGNAVSFSIATIGDRLTYRWLFNGSNIINATSTIYTISIVNFTNAGNYQAVAQNSYGAVTSAIAVLTVAGPPAITIQPASLIRSEGSTATFTVLAAGSMPLSYQWQFDENNLPGSDSPTLSITNVQVADAGDYRVIIANSFGFVTSQVASLTVSSSPVFEEQPTSLTVTQGQTAFFEVDVLGEPPLTYQWRFGGVDLVGETNPTLTIANAQARHAGFYSVVARNELGSTASAEARLQVRPLIFDARINDGIFSLRVDTQTGQVYQLERAVTLVSNGPPVWGLVAEQPGIGGFITFSQPATNATSFYRVRVP